MVADSNTLLYVLVRPRPGDFVYSEEELQSMEYDIVAARESGAAGIVSGVLRADGNIDEVATKRLVDAACPLPFTFHRAFDTCPDWKAAVDSVTRLGCDRLLTSGCASTAIEGSIRLREIHSRAQGRFRVIAASGVRA